MKILTKSDVINFMHKTQGKRTAREFAKELGVGESYLSDVYRGKREPGPSILARLGLEKVEQTYRQRSEAK